MPQVEFEIDNNSDDEIILTEKTSRHIFRFPKTVDGKAIDLAKPELIEPNRGAEHRHEKYRIAAVAAARKHLA